MQSTGKELSAVSCVGYNKKDETIFERLSLHMQVFGKRRGNRNEEKRNRKSGGAGNSCIL